LEAPFVQRVEIISAKEPRRRWSDDEKREYRIGHAYVQGAAGLPHAIFHTAWH
jgi:hypothetical protein